MSRPGFDEAQAHRWFAVEFNNAAWDIVEKSERSDQQLDELLHLAHASALYLSAVGSAVNRQRGADLLARAYAIAGQGTLALRYAKQCIALSEQNGAEQSPFDRAEALAAMAQALRVAGQAGEAAQWHERARATAAGLEADDREVLQRLLKL